MGTEVGMKANSLYRVPSKTLLLATLVAITYFGLSGKNPVDTEAMLDVSVSIRTISNVSIDNYGDSVWAPGTGSGFLVSTQTCEVWTNHHVIDNAAVIEVFPRGWQKPHGIIATLVNSTPHTDIAILQMESCDGLPAARIGNSQMASVGDETYVVGNPFGSNPDSISRGIISHTSRYLSGPAAYFQTDAAVNPGNSGGALFNRDGAVIGLTTAIAATSSGSNVGIGYALPINTMLDKVAALRTGPPSWGDAGINDIIAGLTAEEAAIFHVPDGHGAVNITRSPETGPSADKLMARDIIYKIDDQAVLSTAQVKRIISSRKPEDIINFSLIRDGEPQVVSVTLADGWSNIQKPQDKAQDYNGLLGMKVEMWSKEEGERGQFSTPVITLVYGLGPAHLSYITSSQSTVGVRGQVMIPFQISVNTVTGVVIEGEYNPVSDIPTLEQLANKAYDNDLPILLEIESWYRDPSNFYSELEYATTAFHKIQPAPSVQQTKAVNTRPNNYHHEASELKAEHRS
jgi:S1-C subfamily serine protease